MKLCFAFREKIHRSSGWSTITIPILGTNAIPLKTKPQWDDLMIWLNIRNMVYWTRPFFLNNVSFRLISTLKKRLQMGRWKCSTIFLKILWCFWNARVEKFRSVFQTLKLLHYRQIYPPKPFFCMLYSSCTYRIPWCPRGWNTCEQNQCDEIFKRKSTL